MDRSPTIINDGLPLLHELLSLAVPEPSSSNVRETILVAVDFEYINNITKKESLDTLSDPDSQAGLAILDTISLNSLQLNKSTRSSRPIILQLDPQNIAPKFRNGFFSASLLRSAERRCLKALSQ